MKFRSDIEIAQDTKLEPIEKIAKDIGIEKKYIELYGNYKAKVDYNIQSELNRRENGKLILVTAITPTPS
jgi:formate--tetrahydrofolate ligase